MIELDLLPTRDEVEAYRRRGFHVSKRLFDDRELDAAIAALMRPMAALAKRLAAQLEDDADELDTATGTKGCDKKGGATAPDQV